METAPLKSDGKQINWSGNGKKQTEIIQKTFLQLFGCAVAVSGTEQGETPESLVTPAFVGFPPVVENGIKAALTT